MSTDQTILDVIIDATGARRGADAAASAFESARDRINSANANIQSNFNKMSAAAGNVIPAIRSIGSAFSQMASIAGNAISYVAGAIKNQFSRAFDNVLAKMGTLLSYLGPVGLGLAIKSIAEAGILFQKLSVTMSVVTGNMKNARNELQYLLDISNKLGLSIDAAAAPFAKFFAAAKNAIKGSDIRDIFNAFAEVSVALSLNKQEVTGVFLALQQIASKGKVSMEELRLQLAERVPGAMAIAAESMGMSMREFEDEVRKGSISASDFLKKFADNLHKYYGVAAVNASTLAQAALNRFHNEWLTFRNAIAENGVLKNMSGLLDDIREKFLGSATAAKSISGVFNTIIIKIREFLGALSSEDVTNYIVNIANAFIKLYNVLLDLVPEAETFAKAFGYIASAIVNVKDYVSGGSEELKKLQNELSIAKQTFEAWQKLPKMSFIGDDNMRKAREYELRIESIQKKIDDLNSGRGRQSQHLPLLTPEDFKVGDKISIGDSSNLPGDYAQGVKEKVILERLFDVENLQKMYDATEELFLRHEMALQDVLDTQKKFNEEYAVASDTTGKLDVNTRLGAAEKLSPLLEELIKQKKELDKVSKMIISEGEQEFKRLESGINSVAASMGGATSYGRELMQQALNENRAIVDEAQAYGLASAAQAAELREVIELEHQAALGNISAQGILERMKFEQMTTMQQIDTVSGILMAATGPMAAHSKKMFEINKAAGMANSIVSTITGATKAFELGPIIGPPLAAIVMAAGMANVAMISQTKFGGSAPSGGGSVGSTSSNISPPTPSMPAFDNTFVSSDINGRSIDSSGAATNINFNISALDGRSVAAMLESNKGTINSIVQDSYDRKGNRGGPLR